MVVKIGIVWIFALLLLLVGCTDRDYDGRYEAHRHGTVIIGPGEYHGRVYRSERERREYERRRGYHPHQDNDDRRGRGDRRDNDDRRDRDRRDGGGWRRSSDEGPAGDVELIGTDVRPAGGPVLNSFELSLFNVKYSPSPFHVLSVEDAWFSTQTTEANINTCLNQRLQAGKTGLRDITLVLLATQVQLTGMVIYDGRDMPCRSTGTLRPDGARVLYVPTTFTVNGTALSDEYRQVYLDQINPIVDLSGLQLTPTVQRVTPGQGMVTVYGTAVVNNLP